MSNHVAIEESYRIPGYNLYDKDLKIEKDFRLRAMTTMEEKLRLSSPGFDTIAKIIKSCLLTNKDLDINQLKIFDIQFLMYKLRTVTYGPDYPVEVRCPHCGQTMKTSVNLDNLKVIEVPDDFKEPFSIGPLPVSGDTLECKIFSTADYLDILKDTETIQKNNPEIEDPSFILELMKKVVSVNGKKLLESELKTYLETMHARDYQYFNTKYNTAVDDFGMDTITDFTCDHCKKDFKQFLPMTSKFFRPSLDD